MLVKKQLIDLMDESKQAIHQLYAGLNETERTKPGAVDHWAAKDIIAHITVWNDRLADEIEGMTFPPVDDLDKTNADVYLDNANDGWNEVLDASDRAFERLIQHTQNLSEEELADPQRYSWSRKNIPWRQIVGNAYTHTLIHLSQNYTERGDVLTGQQIQETGLHKLLAIDPSDHWRGTNLYNLACFYATTGQKERALELLVESLQLNSTLLEWSKKDPDLDSLRSEITFQALYSA